MMLNQRIKKIAVFALTLTAYSCESPLVKPVESETPDFNVQFPVGESRFAQGNLWASLISANGHWAKYLNSDSSTQFPAQLNVSSIKSGGLWITAESEGEIFDACATESGSDFTPGRIINQNLPVEELKASSPDSFPVFILSSDPNQSDNFFWPTRYGAPAVGNFQARSSNLDTWSVFHDLNSSKLSSEDGKQPMGIEGQMTTWMFDESYLQNVLFVRYRVINKSNRTYTNVRIANWLTQGPYWKGQNWIASDSMVGSVYLFNYSGGFHGRTLGIHMISCTGVVPEPNHIGITNYFYSSTPYKLTQNERYHLTNGLTASGSMPSYMRNGWWNPHNPRLRIYVVLPSPLPDGILIASFQPVVLAPGASVDAVFAVYGPSIEESWDNAVSYCQYTGNIVQIFSDDLIALP